MAERVERLHRARRWFRLWVGALSLVTVIALIGALASYVRVRPLVHGPHQPVTGTVVDEQSGLMGVRNLLTVDYVAGGEELRAEIPVKGDGFGGPRIPDYYYRRGLPVGLLVSEDDAELVRTADRWSPAFENWLAVAATAVAATALVAVLGRITVRTIEREIPEGPPPSS